MRNSLFTFYFLYRDGSFDFEIGWFWIVVGIALIWWL